jgi:hypothetical protein
MAQEADASQDLSRSLLLTLDAGGDADAEERERLGRQLWAELRQLDVEDVRPTLDGEAPPGAKAVDPMAWQTLLVSLGASGSVLATVVGVLRDWLGRHRDSTVKVILDGDELEFTAATAGERAEIVAAFVRAHGGS